MPRVSRPAALGAALAVVALIAAGGVLFVRNSAGAAEPLKGSRVSDADLRILATVARSCPMLTPARLAGQIQVASNFGDRPVPAMSAGGAAGVAALTPEVWKRWAPWPGATPADRPAGITALAHEMCQLAGQARVVKVHGDAWQMALAAHRGGMDAVVAAGGVPDGVREYVNTVTRYAAWYALQPQFGPSTPAVGDFVDTAVVRVPDPYVKAVVSAGKVCPEMPPARIAAQIMATSGFDPQRLGPTGEQGIAQFRPQIWRTYGPSAESRTPWDPADAIPALGETMCALVGKASGAYPAALALFTRGRGGEPVPALADAVAKDQAQYAKDTRLRTSSAPSPARSHPSASATPSRKATLTDQVRANQPPVKNAGKASYGPYFIENYATRECADLPGNGPGAGGGVVHQYPCNKTGSDNQEFVFLARKTDGSGNELYLIKNAADNLCLDPPGNGTVTSGTSISEANCAENDNQYFRLELRFASSGFEYYRLHNTAAGDMCLDLPGRASAGPDAQLALVPCLPNDDHEWALVQRSEW
jgi:Ricin-type beta-trefoil lectin domain-like